MRAEGIMKSGGTAPNLSESIHQQLNMYENAAGAAGVSLLALAEPTEAKIVYTPEHVVIGTNQHYDLDLNHDGITDFTITDPRKIRHCHEYPFIMGHLSALPNQGNGIQSRFELALALSRGTTISPLVVS
jgi:hypothetical protein